MFLTILIFVDILFLATGQITGDSSSALIVKMLSDPAAIKNFDFWTMLIPLAGFLAFGTALAIGVVTKDLNMAVFAPIAFSLSILIGDFIAIFNYLAGINKPFAIMVIAPFLVLFPLVVVEWLKNKD